MAPIFVGLYHIFREVASLCKRGDTMNDNLKIGFIGAGKVGFSLGRFFVENHIQVTGYYSRHKDNAVEAADFTGTRCYDELSELVEDNDAIFLTVSDGAISSVYQELTKYDITDKMICHCSGALSSMEAFPQIKAHGATGYSIHPLFPVSSKYESFRELSDAFFCLEGDSLYIDKWMELLSDCRVRTRRISAADKVKYHCGCVVASNLVCALMDESIGLLASCGFTEREAREALSPLVNANIGHILSEGPIAALTGPLERADADTIKKHMAALEDGIDKELYVAASRRLIAVAQAKNPDRDYKGDLKSVLSF